MDCDWCRGRSRRVCGNCDWTCDMVGLQEKERPKKDQKVRIKLKWPFI